MLDMESSIAAFDKFVQSCIFIHDDVLSELRTAGGELDWDQFGTNPFFIGANVCVVDTLEGFGQAYLNYLSTLNCLPKNIITPSHHYHSLLENLLADKAALKQLESVTNNKQLNISSFYTDDSKNFEKLIKYLSRGDYTPSVYPSKESFRFANNKILARDLFVKAEVPVPDGFICTSIEDLQEFYKYCTKIGSSVLLKKLHWQTIQLRSEEEIKRISDRIDFPVIVERVYPVKFSPVSHHIRWNYQTHHLFTVNQHIENWKHYGNRLPHGLSVNIVRQIVNYSSMIINQIPEYAGVCGIDYIVTPENKIMAVDLNPRFNSSTYPFYFLQRMQVSLESIWAIFRFARVPVQNLSSLFTDSNFIQFNPNSSEGILLMTPVFDFTKEIVVRFLYLIVAKNSSRLTELEKTLMEILTRKQIKI